MPYIKPKGERRRFNVTLMPCTTQNGYDAVRFIGEDVPDTYTAGFYYYDDDNSLIADLTAYRKFYMHNMYSVKKDTEIDPKPNNSNVSGGTESTYGALITMITDLNNKVADLTPYTESKQVYIRNTSCEFDKVKDGNVVATLTLSKTEIPCEYEIINNKIIVHFEELEEPGIVTITITGKE